MRPIAVLLLLAAAGCSVEAPAAFTGSGLSAGARASDADDDDDDDGDDRHGERSTTNEGSPDVPAHARGHVQMWMATVPATETIDFGGDGFCKYHVVLTDVQVRVTFDEEGRILSSTVNHATNETTDECPHEAFGLQESNYSFRSAKGPQQELSVSFRSRPEMVPQADLSLKLEPIDADHLGGVLHVQRIGTNEPLLWKIDINVELTPVSD